MILTIITIMALGFFITEFEPLHISLDWLRTKLPDNLAITFVFGSFSCWQCMSFWSGWIYTGQIFTAIIASMVSVIVYGWMQKK